MLLLGAVALGRVGFGIVLVVAFSFGLAVLLTAIGLLMVYAHRLFDRFSFEARLPRLLPVASALAMALAGVGIVPEALGRRACSDSGLRSWGGTVAMGRRGDPARHRALP